MSTKYLDNTGLALVWAKIKLLLSDKVDKVSGKGLSSNDYTAEEKAKLANIAAGAEVNVNADWNAATGDAAILNKPSIPSKTSDLTNDSGFITSSDVPEGAAATTTTPAMDGTAAVGTETTFARGDHVHPSDTTKVDKVDGKGLSTNDYTTTEKNKLAGIAEGAEVNQNAFSNVLVGETTVAADGKTDTLELVAGSNITLTPDATNDKVTIAATDTTYSAATTSADGLMSSTDKTKLDGIATGAEVNQNAFSNVLVGSTTVAADGKTDTLELVAGSNVTLTPDATNDKITIAATDTTYSAATTSANGLMSSTDKTKLDGVATGAQVNVIEAITVNNSATTISNKTVNITVPTNNNQLTNGAGYQTASDVSSAISSAIGDLEGIEFEIVQSLPVTGDKGKIYLIADTHSDQNDSYDEYIWLTSSSAYEKIGNTDVDLSSYYNTTNMVAITSNEIDTICT